MRIFLSATAVVALLAAAPVMAQQAPPMTPPATDAPAVTVAPPPADVTPPAVVPVEPITPITPPVTSTLPPADVTASYLAEQGQGEILASEIMGKSVWNTHDENLGDINDILFDQNGTISAVVVGVGGFLGIGEKDVAIPYAALQPTAETDGEVKMIFDTNKEALENAPEFVTLDDRDETNTGLPPAPEVVPANPPADATLPPGGIAPAPAR